MSLYTRYTDSPQLMQYHVTQFQTYAILKS